MAFCSCFTLLRRAAIPDTSNTRIIHARGNTTSMKTVFVLHHSYSVGDREDVKLIGVYASLADAEAAVSRLAGQPGFRDHTDGFNIDAYEIGLDHWQEGFVSIVTIIELGKYRRARVWIGELPVTYPSAK